MEDLPPDATVLHVEARSMTAKEKRSGEGDAPKLDVASFLKKGSEWEEMDEAACLGLSASALKLQKLREEVTLGPNDLLVIAMLLAGRLRQRSKVLRR